MCSERKIDNMLHFAPVVVIVEIKSVTRMFMYTDCSYIVEMCSERFRSTNGKIKITFAGKKFFINRSPQIKKTSLIALLVSKILFCKQDKYN